MRLYFAGAESPSHLNTLRNCGVERVGVNITNLARHNKNLAAWASQDRLSGLEWVIYADSPDTPWNAALEVVGGASVAPEMIVGPVSWAEETWLRDSDFLFVPLWDGNDASVLRRYVEEFDGVVLPDAVVDNAMATRTARAAVSNLGHLGAITGRSKGLERFDAVTTSAWWAVQKYGETQVWAANRLVRLNADDKHLKRQRYLPAIEGMGVDPEAILADDPRATTELAIRSWLSLEAALTARHTPISESEVDEPTSPRTLVSVPGPGRVANAPRRSGHQLLPVMTFTQESVATEDGDEREVSTLSVAPESLMRCDTCSLAAACPAMTPGAACAYEMPVEIRSKDQLQSVLRAMVEIQTQRVLMGRFGEQINGQADDQVGRELDRLFQMVERWRNIEDNRDTLKMTVEARGNMGVISRLFGKDAGESARMLDRPVMTADVLDDAEV
jgi:hypothetical protein